MAFSPRRFDQILQDMINRVVARTALTDLNDGAVLLQILAAAAREDDEQYVQMTRLLDLFGIETAAGDDLDDRARDLNPVVIARRAAVRATGTVVFSRTGTTGTVTIPTGTIVGAPSAGGDSITFQTTAAGSIANGSTASAAVAVTCDRVGVVGNVALGAINQLVTPVAGVESVTNGAAFTTGADRETDDSFRDRIRDYIRSLPRATKAAVRAAALTASDAATGQRIVHAAVTEDPAKPGQFTLVVSNRIAAFGTASEQVTVADDELVNPSLGGETRFRLDNWPVVEGTAFTLKRSGVTLVEGTDYGVMRASGEVLLYAPLAAGVNLRAGPYTYFTGLLHEVAAIIEGDPASPVTKPGYRAAGCFMLLKPVTPYHVSLAGNITVVEGHDAATVFNAVKSAWTRYVNGLGISEDILVAELVDRAMDVAGVQNVQEVTIDGVAADAAVPDESLAFTTANLITLR